MRGSITFVIVYDHPPTLLYAQGAIRRGRRVFSGHCFLSMRTLFSCTEVDIIRKELVDTVQFFSRLKLDIRLLRSTISTILDTVYNYAVLRLS